MAAATRSARTRSTTTTRSGSTSAPTGTTPNDDLDGDSGPNQLQNGPEIESATDTTVDWELESEPGTDYRLDFFASDACDPSGSGEAQTYLDSITVTTNNNGHVDGSTVTALARRRGQAGDDDRDQAGRRGSRRARPPSCRPANRPRRPPTGVPAVQCRHRDAPPKAIETVESSRTGAQPWSPTSISAPTRGGRRRPRRAPRRGSTAGWCGPTRSTTRRRSGASSARSSTTPGSHWPTGASPTRSDRTTTSSGRRSTRSTSPRRSRRRATRSRRRAHARTAPRRSSGRSSRRSGAATRPTTRRPTSSHGTPNTPRRWVTCIARMPAISTSPRCSPTR